MRAAASMIQVVLACAAIALWAPATRADPPTTWAFTIETEGQDVFWKSPTAVNPSADRYWSSYQITKMVVTVRYLFFEFDVDVTDQIPPEQAGGSGTFAGPAPVTLADQDVVYPPPPDPPGFAAHVRIWLDGAGYGHADVTNVYLGDVKIELPGFGTVTAHLEKIHIEGTVSVQPLWEGDLNCDGVINAFDIDPFVLALTDPAAYEAAYPNCDRLLADVNDDGEVNAFDIDPFVDLLTG